MPAYSVLVAAVIAVALLGANAVYGFMGSSSSGAAAQRTATVAVGIVQSSVSASGNVSVAQSASADFSTSGTIASVDVAVGDRVKAGTVLGTLDSTSQQAAVLSAQASLTAAEESLATANSGPTAAQQASNSSSLQQAQSQLTSAQQQLAADQETLAEARQQLAADTALGCPASAGSGAASGGSSGSAGSSSSSAAAGGSSASAGASAAGGTGSGSGGGSAQGGSSGSGAGSGPGSGTTRSNGLFADAPAGGASGSTASGQTAAATSAAEGPAAPTVVTGQASAVTMTTARLVGNVNPAGSDTTYRFEYGLSTSLGLKTATVGAGSGTGSVSVSAEVTGLAPGKTYFFRVVASNDAGTVNGAEEQLTTAAPTEPVVATGPASDVTTTTATLTGSVNPAGSDTTYRFEYGLSASLGLRTGSMKAGSGESSVSVELEATGLKPGKTYFFRLVATNAGGTVNGAEETPLGRPAAACRSRPRDRHQPGSRPGRRADRQPRYDDERRDDGDVQPPQRRGSHDRADHAREGDRRVREACRRAP